MSVGDAATSTCQPAGDEQDAVPRPVQHIHVETCCGHNQAVEREVWPAAPPPSVESLASCQDQ